MTGRAYLYSLAAGGERGVDHVLAHLRDGFEQTLALTGNKRVPDLTRDLVRWRNAD